MQMQLRKPHYEPVLFLNGQIINVAAEVRFLGIAFDSKLKWTSHLEQLTTAFRKSRKALWVLAHHKWGSNPKTLLYVYNMS